MEATAERVIRQGPPLPPRLENSWPGFDAVPNDEDWELVMDEQRAAQIIQSAFRSSVLRKPISDISSEIALSDISLSDISLSWAGGNVFRGA